jgi:hypothetical protein
MHFLHMSSRTPLGTAHLNILCASLHPQVVGQLLLISKERFRSNMVIIAAPQLRIGCTFLTAQFRICKHQLLHTNAANCFPPETCIEWTFDESNV